MHNVTLPTPVALAGAALCLLAGYLIGVVAGPDTTARTTAVVDSYDRKGDVLCLRGEAVETLEPPEGEGSPGGATEEGPVLCGTWQRTPGTRLPSEGDEFRFVTVTTTNEVDDESATYIYGDVVG